MNTIIIALFLSFASLAFNPSNSSLRTPAKIRSEAYEQGGSSAYKGGGYLIPQSLLIAAKGGGYSVAQSLLIAPKGDGHSSSQSLLIAGKGGGYYSVAQSSLIAATGGGYSPPSNRC